jgi:hypothetical protein
MVGNLPFLGQLLNLYMPMAVMAAVMAFSEAQQVAQVAQVALH